MKDPSYKLIKFKGVRQKVQVQRGKGQSQELKVQGLLAPCTFYLAIFP
jgi:hypothetical protein